VTRDAWERDVTKAWLTANLQRAAKMPALKSLLASTKVAPPEVQSVKTHKVMLAMIGSMHGIQLKPGTRRKGTPRGN